MPTWGELLGELNQLMKKGEKAPFDIVRRKYLSSLSQYTGRNTIIYSSKWTQGTSLSADVSINDEDVEGFMEVFHGLKGDNLDLILHSPGGFAEATEAIVSYMRAKFKDVRIIIPYAAMSAAAMLACSANNIVLGKHSFMGPIDPQMRVSTQLGIRTVPAQAILDQFEMAKSECQDPKKLASWLPILSQYGPSLLIECQNALDLSKLLVSEWLQSYMFAKDQDPKKIASKISKKLAEHGDFKSHGRHINREKLKEWGMVIENLEKDQRLQDLVLSVFHATTHTFNGTPAVKIIENQNGKAFMKQQLRIDPVPKQIKKQK